MSQFTKNVAAIRKSKDLSIQEIADRIGIERSYLSRVLSGHHSPGLELAEKIAKACGVTLSDLLASNFKKNLRNGIDVQKTVR